MGPFLDALPSWTIAAVIIAAAAMVLAVLNTLACAARNEMQIHMLRVETARLQCVYLRRMRARMLFEDEDGDVDIVTPDSTQTPAAQGRKAA